MDSNRNGSKVLVSIKIACSLVASLLAMNITSAQGQGQEKPEAIYPSQKIAAVMRTTLDGREILVDGKKLWVPRAPTADALRQVKEMGDTAITALTEYLRSGSLHERELAEEFLEDIGSVLSIQPLLTVVRDESNPMIRKRTVGYIAREAWEVAQPILKQVAEVDPDPSVREWAQNAVDGRETRSLKSPSAGILRARIAQLMIHTVKKSEFQISEGVKASIRVLPDGDAIDEIKYYGDQAVPLLAEYLNSQDQVKKTLALRLLGNIETQSIVAPVERVLREDPLPYVREQALWCLMNAPWDLVSGIFQQAADNDSDPEVRMVAQGVIRDKHQR